MNYRQFPPAPFGTRIDERQCLAAIDEAVKLHLPNGMDFDKRQRLAWNMQASGSLQAAAEVLSKAILPHRPMRARWFDRAKPLVLHPEAFHIELTRWAEFV